MGNWFSNNIYNKSIINNNWTGEILVFFIYLIIRKKKK